MLDIVLRIYQPINYDFMKWSHIKIGFCLKIFELSTRRFLRCLLALYKAERNIKRTWHWLNLVKKLMDLMVKIKPNLYLIVAKAPTHRGDSFEVTFMAIIGRIRPENGKEQSQISNARGDLRPKRLGLLSKSATKLIYRDT